MQIYIDESGSINNHNAAHCPFFVIALVRMINKKGADRAYKHFVASNIDQLKVLDEEKKDSNGKVIRPGGRMFANGKFTELKGSCFDASMKRKFLAFLHRNPILKFTLLK